MIESLFEQISGLPKEVAGQSEGAKKSTAQVRADDSVIAALPIVRAIVKRKVISTWHDDASDLVQGIALRLLRWRRKYLERSKKMSADEWESFAARTAYNEVNRYFTSLNPAENIPIDYAKNIPLEESAEGQTEGEFISLAILVWQNICSLSLRQRRALLLNSQDLIIYLLKAGISEVELVGALEFDGDEWKMIKDGLPLTDSQIAALLRKKIGVGNIESITRSIKKGRHEARRKMRRMMER